MFLGWFCLDSVPLTDMTVLPKYVDTVMQWTQFPRCITCFAIRKDSTISNPCLKWDCYFKRPFPTLFASLHAWGIPFGVLINRAAGFTLCVRQPCVPVSAQTVQAEQAVMVGVISWENTALILGISGRWKCGVQPFREKKYVFTCPKTQACKWL